MLLDLTDVTADLHLGLDDVRPENAIKAADLRF